MKRLSGLDASFLYLETPSMHMHVSGFGVFDPSTATQAITYERMPSGALRRYFESRSERVEGDLVASVPISVRTEQQKGEQGNQVSSMLCSLANTVRDPIERLHAISEGTKARRNGTTPSART